MTEDTVKALPFRALRDLEVWVRVALGEKREEAEAEYRARARELADEYGFKIAGLPGRPRRKKPARRERSTAIHDGAHEVGDAASA
jgi:hypothetical protein